MNERSWEPVVAEVERRVDGPAALVSVRRTIVSRARRRRRVRLVGLAAGTCAVVLVVGLIGQSLRSTDEGADVSVDRSTSFERRELRQISNGPDQPLVQVVELDGRLLGITSDGGTLAAWSSPDGKSWTVVGEVGFGQVYELVAGPEQLVAVGTGAEGATAWLSSDGTDWQETVLQGGAAHDVAFDEDGEPLVVGSAGSQAVVWSQSDDDWEVEAFTTGTGDARGVVVAGSTVVVVGYEDADPWVWRKDDRSSDWQAIPLAADDDPNPSGVMQDITIDPDGRLLAVGVAENRAAQWTSEDGGESWSIEPSHGPSAVTDAGIESVVTAEDGVYAYGWHVDASGYPSVWRWVQDALWDSVPIEAIAVTDPTTSVQDVTVAFGGIVAVGQHVWSSSVTGAGDVVVPSVEGMTLEDAQAVLARANLTGGPGHRWDADDPDATVAAQQPDVGEVIPRGSAIGLRTAAVSTALCEVMQTMGRGQGDSIQNIEREGYIAMLREAEAVAGTLAGDIRALLAHLDAGGSVDTAHSRWLDRISVHHDACWARR
jgi:hypothetical protein